MDHKLCKDCKGFCCDDIGMNMAPHELQNAYHMSIQREDRGKTKVMSMSIPDSKIGLWYDVHLIYPMLVFSHQDYIHPDGDLNTKNEGRITYHYSCKHHNKKTKDCDIYEERPMMCRSFPDNGFCGYRKVRDKRVIACRPEWFKVGLSYHDWYYGMHPDEKPKEDKPTDENLTEVKAEETK